MPAGGLAVANQRRSPVDSLDDFPTPPWGTRALIHHVLGPLLNLDPDEFAHRHETCWEPAANRRIMSDVLQGYFRTVYASDVHHYGYAIDEVGSFVGAGGLALGDVARGPRRPDWVITNPPFTLGTEFVERALDEAVIGVAMLLRTNWIESGERYDLFSRCKPAVFAPFSGRLAMVEGRWDPDAATMTSYSWFVWLRRRVQPWEVMLIPPDAERRLTRRDDRRRFADRR